jgi:pimeloyl-ACP methyl ester carboxylesterase
MKILIATSNNDISIGITNKLKELLVIEHIDFTRDIEDLKQYFEQNNTKIFLIDFKLNSNNVEDEQAGLKFYNSIRKKISNEQAFFIFITTDKRLYNEHNHIFHHNNVHFHFCSLNNPYWQTEFRRKLKVFIGQKSELKNLMKAKDCIFFVHGFMGNQSTWKYFKILLEKDDELKKLYDYDFFNYKTFGINPLVNLKIRKYTNIEGLAFSLKTHLMTFNRIDEFVLVGHSMGCLVIRQFLILNIKLNWNIKIKKIILLAAPNNGSNITRLIRFIYWNNPHLKELTPNSSYLQKLNNEWVEGNYEAYYEIKAFLSYVDNTVNPYSAAYSFSIQNIESVPNRNHTEIVRPTKEEDTIYKNFRNYLFIENQ